MHVPSRESIITLHGSPIVSWNTPATLLNPTLPGRSGPAVHLCFCQRFSSINQEDRGKTDGACGEHTYKKKANVHFALSCALASACSGCLPKPWAAWHPVLAPSTREAQGNSKAQLLSDSNNPKQSNTSTTPFQLYMGIKQVCRKHLQKLNTDIALAPEKKKSKKRGKLLNTFTCTPSLPSSVAVTTEQLRCRCHLLIALGSGFYTTKVGELAWLKAWC